MPIDAFEAAMNFVLRWEGGYVNDPYDPGGETKYGISKRQYPHLDIKNLTLDQAKEIYRRDYWAPSGCDKLPPQAAVALFDTAVNIGVRRALSLWSQSGGRVEDFLWKRVEYYVAVPDVRFLKGWIRRVLDLRRQVAALASRDTASPTFGPV
jgi:hypothetical protein